jgi:hypothetical protein
MSLTVKQRAEHLGTFRFVQVHLLETLAAWVPSTPEMEIKVLFGRHIWDLAQQADAIGRRTNELRAPLHFTVPPVEGYLEVLRQVRSLEATEERIAAFYDVALRDLETRYREYLKETDSLLDEPSCRVVGRALGDFERMRGDREEALREWPKLRNGHSSRLKELAQNAAGERTIVSPRATAGAAREAV